MSADKENYHFIGIGGIGMSGLARILIEKQHAVSGSDLQVNKPIEALVQKGAKVSFGHSSAHLPKQATVVYSSGINSNNPELVEAKGRKCKLLHRSELIAELMHGHKKALAVTGAHGKTTVSSLLTFVLQKTGCDPTFTIGGMLEGTNGKWGSGDYFVAEADESDGTFLNYHPHGAIVTNIDHEHMNHFQTEENLHASFCLFMQKVVDPSLLFFCGDDAALCALAPSKAVSYGFSNKCQLHITSFHQHGWESYIEFTFEGQQFKDIKFPLIGSHNALNVSAVFGLCLKLGLKEEMIRNALDAFPGVDRRLQKRGETMEILLLDDYGHHPTEVKTTLMAIRQAIGERRLIVIFQPHRYSRMKDHITTFSRCFDCVDHLFVTDIYAALEEPIAGVTTDRLLSEILKQSTVPASYLPKEDAVDKIHAFIRPHDVVVTIGAGDITSFHTHLYRKLSEHGAKKFVVGLIFGGRSCEHEISLRSCRFIDNSLSRSLYDVRYFGIDKEGLWITAEEALNQLHNNTVISSPNAQPLLSYSVVEALNACDLFFPVLHGPFGEDGTLQGFFELLGKPYAGPGFRGSAICMDKVLTKKCVSQAGVPTPAYTAFGAWEWHLKPEEILLQIEKLRYPLFVKPSHVGSSVGITKVEKKENLLAAIDYALRYDMSVLVEEGVEGCRELEFAVLGNHEMTIVAPPPGEKLADGQFVDYEKKYGKNAVKTTLEPQIPPDVLKKGQAYAKLAYESTGNSGMTRVDFLLDDNNDFWFFEMNPIPGLQPLSLFPKIWNREGLNGEKLANRLIILGLERLREQNRHLKTL